MSLVSLPARPSRLRDVAARAGVSPITVSRVIRTPDKVAHATRERVEAAINAIDYIPNAIARSLASSRSKLVVAIFPNLGNPLFAETVAGLNEVLNENGMSLVVGNVGHSAEAEEALIGSILAHRPCAMFLHRTIHTKRTRRMLRGSGMVVVEGGNLVARPVDAVVSYSHKAAAQALTTVLLDKGRRNVAFAGSPDSDRHAAHFAGYCAALAGAGLGAAAQRPLVVTPSYRGGEIALQTLLAGPHPVDGVVFASVAAASGALLECARSGVPVPHSLSIVSLDDSDLAPCLSPPLTAIRISRLELGRRSAEIIVSRLSGRSASKRLTLSFEIVVRGSS